ncbi:hypothetical protein [Kribbella sp. NPDC050459]|uniref:hypothetical protein n=1 Tax=Kribbella sp. NPDC050459 TaxID=3155785 RepID=UPI0033C28D2F
MSTEATRSPAGNGTADPVRAVSVISTGGVEIHSEHAYGTRKPLYWWLLTSRRWLPPRTGVVLPAHDPIAADRLIKSSRWSA